MNRVARWCGSARAWVAAVLAAALLTSWILTPVMAAQAATPAATSAAEAKKAEDAKKAEAAKKGEDELEEVKITGTGIQVPGATSANPIESITAEEMRRMGIVNVSDVLLTLLPQNISQYQPGLVGDIQTTGGGEFGNIGTGFGNGTQGNNEIDRGSFFVGQTVANLRGMGTWTRHGSGQGCIMTISTDTVTDGSIPVRTVGSNLASGDIPSPVTSGGAVADLPGRWPQSQSPSYTDGRPYSLIDYEIRPANSVPSDPVCPTLDKLTVWDTINGVRKDTLNPPVPRLVLCRIVAN